ANPSKGYVAGNALNLTLPVTTTIVHKNPDLANGILILNYMYIFSADNLKSSTFRYNLSRNGNSPQAVDLNQMTDQWQNLQDDHKGWFGHPMYRGQASTTPAALTNIPFTTPGINVSVPFTINMNFAVPAYECWALIFIPVCNTREYEKSNPVPINSIRYDILPA